MFHGLARFSEDLDFILMNEKIVFSWEPYLKTVVSDMNEFGIKFQIMDRSKADDAVKKTFIKTDSIETVILFDLPFERDARKHLRVKLEVDTMPPRGSAFETHFLAFSSAAAVTTQTLSCGLALKLHALLCRTYDKGRDWYDFIWYVSRRIQPDMELMKNAMLQSGPWKNKANVSFDVAWLKKELSNRINKTNWPIVRGDVERFLPKREQGSLDLWKPDLFLYHVEQMKSTF